MKAIIVDDEPLAREAIQLLAEKILDLEIAATFNSATAASKHIAESPVDLIFLDIEMPGISGIEFAKTIFKDILFIEGLKDYVVMQTDDQRIITAMNIKTIHEKLPQHVFARVGKSYVINVKEIDAFDNNTVLIRKYEIPIGNSYRNLFFENFITKKVIGR